MTDNINKILTDYFKSRNDIAFAFLFGSYANGNSTKRSDVDVAVYFYPKKRQPIEFEEEVFYENEDKIWTDLLHLLKKEVDFIVLNRIPATVAAQAIKGEIIIINDWSLYLDFMLVVTSEATDFMEFIIDDFMVRNKIEK